MKSVTSLSDLSDVSLLIKSVQDTECLRQLPLSRWDRLLRLARASNLIGRIAENIQTLHMISDVPKQVYPHLDAALILSKHQRQAIKWEVRHLAEALNDKNVPKILLKGTAYAIADLNAAQGRLFGDVDVLVPHKYIANAEAALMLHGWGCNAVDPYDQRYYRQWMHEIPPMVHRKRGTVIDLHHNILPLTAKNCPNIDLFFENAVPSPMPGFALLSPVDMVLHSATHLFYESELPNGLRDLLDLEALIRQFSSEDDSFFPMLVERAYKTGLSWPILLMFNLVRDILGINIPFNIHEVARNNANLGRLGEHFLTKIYILALCPAHSSTNSSASELCRLFVYLRGHYLRMPLRLLMPHLARKAFLRLFKSSNNVT